MVRTLYRLGSLCGLCALAAGPTDRWGAPLPALYKGPGSGRGLTQVRIEVFSDGP